MPTFPFLGNYLSEDGWRPDHFKPIQADAQVIPQRSFPARKSSRLFPSWAERLTSHS
jgi:hypothetical protein